MFFAGLLLALQPAPMPGPGDAPDDSFPPGSRYADVLASPPESDLYRFPPRPVCSEARRLNVAFRANLEREREVWPENWQWAFDAAISDAQRRYAAWDKLDDCHCFSAVPWWRQRLRLAELKSLLGEAAYAEGRMPPPIPAHWCRPLR